MYFQPQKWSNRGSFDRGRGQSLNGGRKGTAATQTPSQIVSDRLLKAASSADPAVSSARGSVANVSASTSHHFRSLKHNVCLMFLCVTSESWVVLVVSIDRDKCR